MNQFFDDHIRTAATVEAHKTRKRVAFDFDDDMDPPSSGVAEGDKGLLRHGTPHPHQSSKRFKEMSTKEVMGLVDTMPPPPPPPDFGNVANANRHEEEEGPFAEDDPLEEEVPMTANGIHEGGEEQEEGDNEGNGGDDDEDDEDVPQEPTEQDKLWEALREEKLAEEEEITVCFVQGQERYKEAEEKVSDSLKTFHDQMEEAGNRAVQQLVLPIYNVEREKIHGLEADCKKLLMQNHQQRNKFYKDLDAAERRISRGIRALKARTMDIVEQEDTEASPNSKTGGSPSSGIGGSNEGANEEMIWDEMLSDGHQGRVATATLFLTAQQRLENADARFEDAMDRIQGEWKANTDSVIELVKDIHREQQHKVESLDEYIRFDMVKMDSRKKELARKLEEAERNRQAYFSTLMGKVTSKVLGFGRFSKNAKK